MESVAQWAVAAGALLLVGIGLLLLWRQAQQAAVHSGSGQLLREQLLETTRLIGELGQQLASVRAETQADGERVRAQMAQTQAQNLATLQQQVRDMAGLTGQQLEDVRRAMHDRMLHLSGTVGEQLGGHTKVIMEVRGQLGSLSEAAKTLQDLGKDVAGLQDILRAPKLRGNLGELFLEEILRQVLPVGAYEMQHRLPGAERGSIVAVDAVVRLGDRLVPIDSKFPLESFRRLLDCDAALADDERTRRRKAFLDVVRKHIDAVADKYIQPHAGTYDFALAYLPAENIYYEAVVRDEDDGERSVMAHAARRKVIPVSPNTLYAYLLTVAYGLKGLRIEKQAEAIRGELVHFQRKFTQFYQSFDKVGRNLDLAGRNFDDARKRAGKLHDSVEQITGAAHDLDVTGELSEKMTPVALTAASMTEASP